MIIYPQIDPVALSLGSWKIHWYGLMYALGLIVAWGLGNYRASKPQNNWSRDDVADMIFYSALGVVLGGRVGYMIFYHLPQFLSDPLSLFKVWQGGMSFHGGLIGVLIALVWFSYKTKKPYFVVTDFVAPLVPLGLGAGRLGNFINGELWGTVTTLPWGMVYPYVDTQPRHPSQLYEFFLEGIVLFTIIWWFSSKPRPPKGVSGLFMVSYGLIRIFAELFREPDSQFGYLAFNILTMGQILSIPMVILGSVLLFSAYKPFYKRGQSPCKLT